MSDSRTLEGRYRRLLAAYPRAFRRERAEEMLAVLMAGAADGQRRPRLTESADLITHGIGLRVRTWARNPTGWEERHHPVAWLLFRMLNGLWLVLLTGLLCQIGDWWALALLVPAALHVWLAIRLGRFVDRQRQVGDLPPDLPAP